VTSDTANENKLGTKCSNDSLYFNKNCPIVSLDIGITIFKKRIRDLFKSKKTKLAKI
jgi:hypothetical protein